MTTLEELQPIASKISLTLDNPESVKLQVKQITLAQKELRVIKKELSATVRKINQQASQASTDSFSSVVSDVLGKRKLAGSMRADKRRAIQRHKQVARQPYLEIQDAIEQLILEADRLKLLAQEYLLDPEGVIARIQAEEERRRLEEQEREKRLKEAPTLVQISKAIWKGYWNLLDSLLSNYNAIDQQAEKLVQKGHYQSQEEAKKFLKFWSKVVINVSFTLFIGSCVSLSNTNSNQEVVKAPKLETTSSEPIAETQIPDDIIETPKAAS